MINRYGKSSKSLLALKRDFFGENDDYLEQGRRVNEIYAAQPPRTACMNCAHPLEGESFRKQGVSYGICSRCGHLNGLHKDTDEFCAAVYTDEGGKQYGEAYSAENKQAFAQRTGDIYVPKVEFLHEALNETGETAKTLRYADFGAGSGYFVSALRRQGVKEAVGYEVAEAQVALGNVMMEDDRLIAHSIDETIALAETVEADVVSMIGVLQHLQEPREILKAFGRNPNVRFLYLLVPMFSPTVFFEMVFPSIMQRQLGGEHTHLYTEASLGWMAQEFGLKEIASWWFGTDMVDLYRNVNVRMKQQGETEKMVDAWSDMITPLIDALQLELDKKHLSSEVHILYQFEN